MRARLTALLPLVLAACNIATQGNGDLRVGAPPVFSNHSWYVSQQEKLPSGERICTLSGGELNVTLRSSVHGLQEQVANANSLNPGDSFVVLVGSRRYETLDYGRFDPAQSHEIIGDMMHGDTVYSERKVRFSDFHREARHLFPDTIPLQGFPEQYHLCQQFVTTNSVPAKRPHRSH